VSDFAQVIVVGHSFKALPEDAQAAVAHAAIPVSGLDVGGDPIDVPKSRRLAKPAKSKGLHSLKFSML
jgi:hypothetical protein